MRLLRSVALPRLHVLLFAIFINYFVRFAVGECECDKRLLRHSTNFTQDYVRERSFRKINCCVYDVIGYHDKDAVVQWTFEEKPLHNEGDVVEFSCHGQTLQITRVEFSHDGHYSCVVTASNGTVGHLTTKLNVQKALKGFRMPPTNVRAPEAVYAQLGQPANLTCEGIIGEGSVHWYFLEEGEYTQLEQANRKDIEFYGGTAHIDESGKVISTIMLKEVTEEDLGTYVCSLQNDYGMETKNIALRVLKRSKIPQWCVITSACCVLFVVIVPCLWCRFRTALRVKYMEATRGRRIRDGFLRDVFVVHGDEATPWVHDVLVSTLENDYGYECYFPDRDMLGGEQYAEAIAQEMSKCRRVLVVITPCLLQSQWAYWSAHHGIATCFKSSRIQGLVLKELGNDAVSSETAIFLKTLKPIGMLKIPQTCQFYKEWERRGKCSLKRDAWEDSAVNQSQFWVTDPVYVTEDSAMTIPTSQCQSNMITGSNNASRENLDEGKDSYLRNPMNDLLSSSITIKTMEESNDPESPFSDTPFILPGCTTSNVSERKVLTCTTRMDCLRVIFFGKPETIFWQKIRLFLDLPAVGRKITIESTA